MTDSEIDAMEAGPELVLVRNFAIAVHADQRYGPHPYVYHLDRVAEILLPYGLEAQCAGYLHDVIEDTPATAEDVERIFGNRVAKIVLYCTDENGNNRVERKHKTNLKIKSIGTEFSVALIVKAADRLANIRMSKSSDQGKLFMYRSEHESFRAAAFRPGLCDGLWKEMDNVLFGTPSLKAR